MDEFQSVIAKVELAKTEFNQYSTEVPKLKETIKSLKEDLLSLNRELASLLDQKDTVTAEIDAKLGSFEGQKAKELNKLADLQQELDNKTAKTETERTKQEIELTAREEAVTKSDIEATATKQFLDAKQIELEQRETDVTTREKDAESKQTTLARLLKDTEELSTTLQATKESLAYHQGEITDLKSKVSDELDKAQKTNQNAEVAMRKANSKLTEAASKDDEFIKRTLLLDQRQRELDKREIGVRDKEQVRASHIL